jgi:hypothetical protein
MSVIGKSSHAIYFNGVSDSIVCPQGDFTQTGQKIIDSSGNVARGSATVLQDSDGYRRAKTVNQGLTAFSVEAWVSPDCGGVIASKEGLFSLRMGSVNQPAPASFSVQLPNGLSILARTAVNYPTNAASFISNSYANNTGQRELYHILGQFMGDRVKLYINGELMAAEKVDKRYSCVVNDQDLFIGGKGGEYRGYIEAVQWKRSVSTVDDIAVPIKASASSIGLWRFEEPVEVDKEVFYIKSDVTAGSTTITLDTAQCQTLYELVSGKNDSPSSFDLLSLGDYQVLNKANNTVEAIAHTPFNLLINPTVSDTVTGLKNNTPPERVRLKSINLSAGTITVNSIHLDFNVDSTKGARGVLHPRTAFHAVNNLANDSTMVLIRSDLLIDSQTGKPYQRVGAGSQAIDRTGAMIIDESGNDFHGFFYSRNIAVNTNNFAPTTWTIDDKFKTGHSGRHVFSHREGHPYLRFLPKVYKQEVNRTIDGVSDDVLVSFGGADVGVKDQLPINSKVSIMHTMLNEKINRVETSSTTTAVVKNGLSSLEPNKDGIIAIAVDDIKPFLLKGGGINVTSTTDAKYKQHLTPEVESRVAILQVPDMTIPYVEIHYNAIDLTGSKMGVANPCLLVTKTVPDGGSFIDSDRVANHIAAAVSAGAKIHSAGGVIRLPKSAVKEASVALKPHHLVGDNTGGIDYELDLDESKIPANYTPQFAGDSPQQPPLGVGTAKHESAYHLLHLQPRQRESSNPPTETVPTHYQEVNQFASQKGGAFELFDIIDNDVDGGDYIIIVQPSKRERTMQLSRATTSTSNSKDPTHFSIEFVQSTARISSFQVDDTPQGRFLHMECRGIMGDVADQTVSYSGDGSRDSHIVKEIQPGAPVVSVTLGGPGQGAINTKPTWDPASLSRIGWNTRHDCQVEIVSQTTATRTIVVQPLNNNSLETASWGTWCFPETGRIYLPNGANAAYTSRTGTSFVFPTSAIGNGTYILGNNDEVDSFANWVTGSFLVEGQKITLDPLFSSASICHDGTTVNDRLFQSIGSVNHDYQLGTQYASTRALVEIPLFPNQFFENIEEGVIPGPDNSMKLHLDPTMTAHAWNPSPVGRREVNSNSNDFEAFGHYQYAFAKNQPIKVVAGKISKAGVGVATLFLQDDGHLRIPYSSDTLGQTRGTNVKRKRRFILGNGEWCNYVWTGGTATTGIALATGGGTHHSENFFTSLQVGSQLTVGQVPDGTNFALTGDLEFNSSAQEYRRPFYYDRGSVMTQGGNLDYGLRQYASAVEFKAGPMSNPHLPRIASKACKIKVMIRRTLLQANPNLYIFENVHGELPKGRLPTGYAFAAKIESTGRIYQVTYNSATGIVTHPQLQNVTNIGRVVNIIPHPVLDPTAPATIPIGNDNIYTIIGIYATSATTFPQKIQDGTINGTWNNPFCPGGLRYGDTVWMNMHYTNPHAIEGLFCKSRGVLDEHEVWRGFNGGKTALGTDAKSSIPLENFLIGNSCLETARNFVQHVNKTIELNWIELGHETDPADVNYSAPPVVAYLDPYLSTETHARVLLYDVAHDREFISFHDLHMQVQTSSATPTIDGLDVAAGFRSQRKESVENTRTTIVQNHSGITWTALDGLAKSRFVESAYAHGMWFLMDEAYLTTSGGASTRFSRKGRKNKHIVKFGEETGKYGQGRVSQSTVSLTAAQLRHAETINYDESSKILGGKADAYQFSTTFFDTPEGTRTISAFLCLKGKLNTPHDLTNHYEDRLQHLPHWSDMEFVRRLSIDFGSVGINIGNTEIEAAANEVVRLINQAGAPNGRSSQRRPSDQYPGEGERFDVNRRSLSVTAEDTEEPTDATASHHHADFSVTGSTHDPAPFWSDDAFTSFNRGSHMGYLRAHIGRVVTDTNGVEGMSIVIHSTVPGATGRNFCVWLDNSKGQAEYKPQYLIGHGGRFRNFYCSPPEMAGENMHPAPMPIDKNGKPFAPITTLKEYISLDETADDFVTNLHLGYDANYNTGSTGETANTETVTGRSSNTGVMESFENSGQKFSVREGLSVGSRAKARINFGGIVAAGVPGFAPDAGKWGFGEEGNGDARFTKIYGKHVDLNDANYKNYSSYIPNAQVNDTVMGSNPLYGLKMVDHLGNSHILRYIYRKEGESFSHKNSVMPSTIEEETIIYFDDRDIGQGGFTIGANMWGKGNSGTPFFYTPTATKTWRGNEWKGVNIPNTGYAVTLDNTLVANQLKIEGGVSGCGYYDKGVWHHVPNVDDVLGWMGFPDSGLIWLAIPSSTSQYGETGRVFHYSSRTNFGRGAGAHVFYGLQGLEAGTPADYIGSAALRGPQSITDNKTPVIISPHLNQTTIVTDELIAAATAFAFEVDPNEADQFFDCSHLRAPDGRTYGEIMSDNAKTAIRITKINNEKSIIPLKNLFTVKLSPDYGLLSSTMDAPAVGVNNYGGVDVDPAGANQDITTMMYDAGYIPITLLNITTRYRGSNANTATPLLIDQTNNAVDISDWKKHLRGAYFTRYEGDHITPAIDTHPMRISTGTANHALPGGTKYTTYQIQTNSHNAYTVTGRQHAWQLQNISGGTNLNVPPLVGGLPSNEFGGAIDGSWSPYKKIDIDESTSILATALSPIPHNLGLDNEIDEQQQLLAFHHTDSVGQIETKIQSGVDASYLMFVNEVQGIRLRGNRKGNPILYFRGAQDSIDNRVPLYFGGGFSGVVMDINDGSRVDYSTHNKHPYAKGPTGSAGMQDIGEKMGSYALLDTTALYAMFPGTILSNQHRGQPSPPFANIDALLNTDIDGNTNTHTIPNTTYTNVKIAKPVPVVLRFAHPYARYTDANNSVAYMIFGPGQAVPKHWSGEGGAIDASVEPSAKWTVAMKKYCSVNGSMATTYNMGTEAGYLFPNELSNTALDGGANQFLPMTDDYSKKNLHPYRAFRHWEPSYGSPNTNFNNSLPQQARYVSSHAYQPTTVGAGGAVTTHFYSHPFSNYTSVQRYAASITDWDLSKLIFHLEGGYTAGGSWFDNSVRKNPPHPVSATLVNSANAAVQFIDRIGLNATMFRVGSQVLTDYDHDLNAAVPDDVFLIDATRCQNSEELGAVVASAINTWPGRANLKALGGTFLPSFQDAQRQDRYGWIEIGALSGYIPLDGDGGALVRTSNQLPLTLPENGWLRVSNGTKAYYGHYSNVDIINNAFHLGKNHRSGFERMEDPTLGGTGDVTSMPESNLKIYVWAKAGNLRWDNGLQNTLDGDASRITTAASQPSVPTDPLAGDMSKSPFDHYASTQVHFSGVVDAIDRTRAVGAVGWHGERYSMLNSLSINDNGNTRVATGLGPWHPMLGFTPYGAGTTCHQAGSIKWIVRPATGTGVEENGEHVWIPVSAQHDATGLHQRHFIVVSYEGDLPIVAKASRNGQQTCGDMLQLKWSSSTQGGTVTAYHNERFNNDRYNAESNAGPHVEAMTDPAMTRPNVLGGGASANEIEAASLWTSSASTSLAQAESCLYPTGDLFYDTLSQQNRHPSTGLWSKLFDNEVAFGADTYGNDTYEDHRTEIYDYYRTKGSAVRNFFVEHAVWKRMGGGNLTLPAQNARGLGSIPWQIHKVGGQYVKFGETIYGNVRFSFETTNHAMYPVIQAQELAHPALAEQYNITIQDALMIPNEEKQFDEITVTDDTGQEHKLTGGSPLGVIIRDYELVQERGDGEGGLSPALANSGDTPNMKISIPNHDDIPGNILVRAGFDRLQAYQHETIGSGGLQHPSQPVSGVTNSFTSNADRPKTAPYWEQEGYEHINQNPNKFPDSENSLSSTNILETSYEPHDRALYFHVTKMGYTYTEREPLRIISNTMTHNPLTFKAKGVDDSGVHYITVNETINADIWKQDATRDGRYFLSINGTIASFKNVATNAPLGQRFIDVEYAPDFTASAGNSIKPSFYVPAGSTRHFAARRLRDHAEVSGNSPDKPLTNWTGVSAGTSPATAVRAANKLTPMPLPRMGHHYVMPTMAMLPGHLAHPLYQKLYTKHRACEGAPDSQSLITPNSLAWFSGVTAPNPPSDIHGDGFTLLTETKLRFDGYGILDETASCNASGGHTLKLASGTNYNTAWNFPDPAEVGAYQIVIQPNLFSKQLMGNNENTAFGNASAPENPSGTNTTFQTLTDQLVVTVVAAKWSGTGFNLILSEATMADTRGCEVYLNEIMLDIDASTREQFANIPTLGLNNPFGVNATSSGALTRRSLPYHPNMFHRATPGKTVTIPWWSVALKSSTIFGTNKWKRIEHYQPDDYYLFCRSTLGGVGTQTTILGYPSHYLDVYTEYLTSITPVTTIENANQGASKLYVRNNLLFPLVGQYYYNHLLIITDDNGIEQRASYNNRGYVSGLGAVQGAVVFDGVTAITSGFWTAATQGRELRLSSPNGNFLGSETFTDSKKSVATRNLPQLYAGTRDTNSSHLPDAYLCLWHYNLGRPMTWYSDSRTNRGDAAADLKAYNHAPEHFESIHYHEFTYTMSDGPFQFGMSAWSGPGTALDVANAFPNTDYPVQASAVEIDGQKKAYNLGAFWPGGHRFGAQMSSLTLYGTAAPGWRNKWDDPTIKQVSDAKGLVVSTANVETMTETINSQSTTRNAGWGYRISVRQPYNRPRWAIKSNQALRDPYSNYHYQAEGPFVSFDSVTQSTNNQNAGVNTTTTTSVTPSYVGIIERQTNASALIGSDLAGHQVRYSDGRRMTKSFGCAVRNIRNPTTAIRRFHADMPAGYKANTDVQQKRIDLALAQSHYVIDWWGNTTGEDVRRFPVRGFGIRPSWDPQDSYSENASAETMFTDAGLRISQASQQFFSPSTAKRVGDRGDGRGVRYPTYFNQDLLHSVADSIKPLGLTLSHHTSEPPFTAGYIRALNNSLQDFEVPRGISSILQVAGNDGLLKKEAHAGSNIERADTGYEIAREPLAANEPRIGLDGMTVGENDGEIAPSYIVVSTEANSLHTDRQIGQRFIFSGGVSTSDRALSDLRLDTLNLLSAKQVMKFGTTHGIPPLGGTFILEVESNGEAISNLGWGSASGLTTNPYQTSNHPKSVNTNTLDNKIKFLVRPVRVLDNKHIALFREDEGHILSATAGGRYGMFTYDTPNARATLAASSYLRNTNPAPSNPPYAPVYLFKLTGTGFSTSVPSSTGPRIPGAESTSFTSKRTSPVARMIVSNNTLQHLRGDASRRTSVSKGSDEFVRLDYTVQPRYTQSINAGNNLNTTQHSNENNRSDNGMGA